jgi:hypothetical protein
MSQRCEAVFTDKRFKESVQIAERVVRHAPDIALNEVVAHVEVCR